MQQTKIIRGFFIAVISALLFTLVLPAQTVKVQGKFGVNEGTAEGAAIAVSKSGVVFKTITLTTAKFELSLEAEQYFILTFSKAGCVSKKYFIDTHTPHELNRKDFAPIVFDVELRKQSEGQKNKALNQPGGFRYMQEIEGFGYDPGYAVEGESLENESKAQAKEKTKEENKTAVLPGKQEAITKAQEESPKQKTTAKAETENEKRKTYYTNLPDSRTEETINDGKKTTTTITIIKSNIKTVYTKVVHSWGGVFFFMNGESITEAEFDQRTR